LNEFLLVLNDGRPETDSEGRLGDNEAQREKGAFYKNIERKMILKKKRVNVSHLDLLSSDLLQPLCQVHEAYHDKWEVIKVTHSLMSKEEREEREEALAEVIDPMFLMNRDTDADGELDEGAMGVGAGTTLLDNYGRELDVSSDL
jgi:RNA polymerase II-associated factor 1